MGVYRRISEKLAIFCIVGAGRSLGLALVALAAESHWLVLNGFGLDVARVGSARAQLW